MRKHVLRHGWCMSVAHTEVASGGGVAGSVSGGSRVSSSAARPAGGAANSARVSANIVL